MTETLIPIDSIDSNPYQPRKQEDPQAVEELAVDILHHATPDFDGLMQVPTVRAVGKRYQLAFGHTRKAAFAYLVKAGHSRYEEMRVNVRELDDVQMFELAVAENIKRRDLNPIEQADAMHRYMVEFGKTSKEAGEFFGVAEETVRQKVRLLNLPEIAQAKMRAGEINESAARAVLTLTRVLPDDEKALTAVLKDIAEGEKPEDTVGNKLRFHEQTAVIRNDDFPINQKNFKHLPKVTLVGIKGSLGVDSETVIWEGAIEKIYAGDLKTHQDYFADQPDKLETLKKLAHFIKPPACTACPFFAQIDGSQICGFKPCYERKCEAHKQAQIHQLSERLEIPLYDAEDGRHIELQSYNDKHKAYFEKHGEDLRLKPDGRNRYNGGFLRDIPNHVAVVVVGKTCERWKEQDEKKRGEVTASSKPQVDYARLLQVRQIKEAQVELFVWETVAPVFAYTLESVKSVELLEHLLENMDRFGSDVLPESETNESLRKKMTKPARLNQARSLVMFYLLLNQHREYVDQAKPAAFFLKHLKGVAESWGVKLPKDFEKKAQEHDEAVKLAIAEYDKSRGAQ